MKQQPMAIIGQSSRTLPLPNFGDNGMASLDACLPTALVLRLLQMIHFPDI